MDNFDFRRVLVNSLFFLQDLTNQGHNLVSIQLPLGALILVKSTIREKNRSFLQGTVIHDKGPRIACVRQPVPFLSQARDRLRLSSKP